MPRTRTIGTTLLVIAASIFAFGMYARSEARGWARWYCERALTQRHAKDGYAFTYHEPSHWVYESPLYRLTWTALPTSYGELNFKTDAMCVYNSRERAVKFVSLAGNDLPGGLLPHLRKALEDDIANYKKAQ